MTRHEKAILEVEVDEIRGNAGEIYVQRLTELIEANSNVLL